MLTHEQFADDLALYALGELDEARNAEFRQHLSECAQCRREYQQMQDDFSLLAMSVTGSTPPAKSRERLLAAVAREPRMRQPRMVPSRPRWWSLAPVFATAVLAAFAILLWVENNDLRDELDAAHEQKSSGERELSHAREVLTALMAPDAMRMTLMPAKGAAKSQGHVIYQKRTGTLMFFASNLQMPPEKKMYELWLIPMNGHAPMPAGMFKPDASGAAMVSMKIPESVEAKNFAITLEDEAGSSSPSEPAIMTGQGL